MIKDIKHHAQYNGVDEEGNVLMDRNIPFPELTLNGTVKLHGTNAGIQYSFKTGEFKPQKKTLIQKSSLKL